MTLVEVDAVAIKPKAVVGARQIETGEGTTAVVRDSNKCIIGAVIVDLWPKRRRDRPTGAKRDQRVAVCRTANSAASFRIMAKITRADTRLCQCGLRRGRRHGHDGKRSAGGHHDPG